MAETSTLKYTESCYRIDGNKRRKKQCTVLSSNVPKMLSGLPLVSVKNRVWRHDEAKAVESVIEL